MCVFAELLRTKSLRNAEIIEIFSNFFPIQTRNVGDSRKNVGGSQIAGCPTRLQDG